MKAIAPAPLMATPTSPKPAASDAANATASIVARETSKCPSTFVTTSVCWPLRMISQVVPGTIGVTPGSEPSSAETDMVEIPVPRYL